MSAHCEFGTFLDEALRDRFLCGLRSEAIQKKLLVVDSLTFSQAVERAQSWESAASKTKQLQSQNSAGPGESSSKGVNNVTRQEAGPTCYRCGRQNHPSAHCPFKGTKCYNCGKQGHIQQACKQKRNSGQPKKRSKGPPPHRGRSQGQHVKNVQIQLPNQSDSETDDALNHITALNLVNSKATQPYPVELKLDDKPLTMEVDTGASVSLVSRETFKQLQLKMVLKPTSVCLNTYSGEPLPVLGEVDVVVKYNAQQATLPLIIVKKSRPKPTWKELVV